MVEFVLFEELLELELVVGIGGGGVYDVWIWLGKEGGREDCRGLNVNVLFLGKFVEGKCWLFLNGKWVDFEEWWKKDEVLVMFGIWWVIDWVLGRVIVLW